jgi:hypothetical protein
VDSHSTDNPQVSASIFNEYILSVAEKTLPQDNNTNNHTNAGISNIKDKYNSTINSDSSHYLAHAFNNFFLNIQLKFSTTKNWKHH